MGVAGGESRGRALVRRLGGRQVVCLLALALVVRSGVTLANIGASPGRMFKPDSLEYEQYAANLLGHGTYSLEPSAAPRPDSFRPPLYAVLLAAIYGVFGHLPHLVVALQVLLGTATTWLVYDVGRLTRSARLGRWAAALFAVAPAPVLYSGFILSETVFTFLLTGSVRASVRYLRDGELRHAGVSGLLLGLATLTRAIAQFYVAVPAALILVARRPRQLRAAAVLVAGFAAVLLPWVVRNQVTVGTAQVSMAGPYNLFYYYAAAVYQYRHGGDVTSARAALQARVEVRLARERGSPGATPGAAAGEGDVAPAGGGVGLGRDRGGGLERFAWDRQVAAVRTEVAVEEIAGHPGALAPLSVLWLGRLLFDVGDGLLYFARPYEDGAAPGTSWWGLATGRVGATVDALEEVWRGHGLAVGVAIVGFCAVYLVVLAGVYGLAGIGAWQWMRERERAVGLLLVLTAAYLAVLPGPLGELRFRVPLAPHLALLAGAGMEWVLRQWRHRRGDAAGPGQLAPGGNAGVPPG